MSERTVVPREMLHILPDTMSLKLAALVEPMSVAMHAVKRANLTEAETIVVHGGGPIGIGIVLGLAAMGSRRIIAVEPSPSRRAILSGLGVPTVLDPAEVDVVDAVRDLTGGIGADVSFDAAGVPSAFNAALRSTRNNGQFVLVAVHRDVTIQPNDILVGQKTILGSSGYCGDYPDVIKLIAQGHYSVDSWVQHFSVDDVEKALVAARDGVAAKILVDMRERHRPAKYDSQH
jgi:(R,R)-butanediol dehydrogenase/meso-butanediol dehydrogenase/diacetyl reductase